jgi:hypothetical protein
MIGERLGRAEAQFLTKHDVAGLTAKAGELDGIRVDEAAKAAAKRNAEAVKSGDVTKLQAEFDERLTAKDTALTAATGMFIGKLREAFSSIATEKVAGELHDDAKTNFASMVRNSLGVTFDMETQQVSVYPVGPEGNRAYNASGDPLTIEATVKGLLDANPYMRKPTKPGSGAPHGGGGGGEDPRPGYDGAIAAAKANPNRDTMAAALGALVSQTPTGG